MFMSACTGLMPRIGSVAEDEDADYYHDQSEDGVTPVVANNEETVPDLDEEEDVHEDPDALAELLSQLSARGEQGHPSGLPAENPPPPAVVAPPSPTSDPVTPPAHAGSGVVVPAALDNWKQTGQQCLKALEEAGVTWKVPDFKTYFVDTPILLTSPIEGVEIKPRWPRAVPENAVMDCRLALALVNVAREARSGGMKEILFYSTYRPIKPPKGPCEKGRKGKKCRAAKKKYDKAKKGKMSQHRRALAIDIRWFVTDDGETIDVLEDYERHDKEPPCADEPETEAGKFLRGFACGLHATKTFNVILTPNANKDHHNHFHMDITPDATWYIIR